jgi:hypothetical protein
MFGSFNQIMQFWIALKHIELTAVAQKIKSSPWPNPARSLNEGCGD